MNDSSPELQRVRQLQRQIVGALEQGLDTSRLSAELDRVRAEIAARIERETKHEGPR